MARKSRTTEVSISTVTVPTRDGYNLSVKTFGPREGRPVVFLHGFPEFWYGWRKQIPFFEAQGYFVVVPDQRGYNDSDKPEEVSDYALPNLAADVVSIIETLKLDKPVLVGHDWGAAAAWQTAIEYGNLLSKLVILNVPHPRAMIKNLVTNPLQFFKSWYMYFFQLPFLPERLIEWVGYERFAEGLKRTSRRGTFEDTELAKYVEAWSKPGAMGSMINWYRAAFRYPELGDDVHVYVPTLILWGEKDAFLEARMAEQSTQYCESAEVRFFPEATHWLQHEESEAVNRAILEFIS
ncbi:MAG: alpha/beta hydrolase [Spirochaetes bacterium]|nr:alpha/beta hydrolase [Spirochaetota bacterium]MBX3723959.1 alpha/beta hydrolase [Turneriella sp.]